MAPSVGLRAPAGKSEDELDIIVIGGGLSGINAGYLLQRDLPQHRYAILEARDCIGGTWSFWKYPGIRSDSSMAVYGFHWRPWTLDANIAGADQIAAYLEDAAVSQGIDKKIRLRHRVTSCSWSSSEQRWTLRVDVGDEKGGVTKKSFKARWMISCGGYYNYDKPLPTVIPGIESFQGEVVHPQFWTDKVDYADKRVVIIGSGATAVTLLPNLAKTAKHVTMLQRSPSYVASLSSKTKLLDNLRRFLPLSWAGTVQWWINIFLETLFIFLVKTFPRQWNKLLIKGMTRQLPKNFDVQKHFTPRYNVFDQRLCFCPDGDFFKALHQPNTDVVTDKIDTVTAKGIRTASGQFIEADMIVTATGLLMNFSAGIPISVDGTPVQETLNSRYIWNGTMLEGVPNSGAITGYTAATWTPGADARTRTLIKVFKHMEAQGATSATPYIDPEERKSLPKKPAVPSSATYIAKAVGKLPIVADVGPWRNGVRWMSDALTLYFGSVTRGMVYHIPEKEKLLGARIP